MLPEFFSASASRAAKEKGKLVKYRSYKTGTYYDKISERFNFVDIFELQTLHIPLDMQKIQYYREHTDEPIITVSASEKNQIVKLSREPFYSAFGDHIILPLQLTSKRFRFASNSDLELWQEESEEEGIVFAGPIAGNVPVREILEKSGEDLLMHEASSNRDAQVREMTDSNGSFLKTVDPSFFHDYQEDFTIVEKPCNRFDCSICYGGLQIFDKPTWFIRGLPQDHKDVLTLRFRKGKEQKLRYLTKLAKFSEISFVLSQLSASEDAIDAPSLDDYYNSLQ